MFLSEISDLTDVCDVMAGAGMTDRRQIVMMVGGEWVDHLPTN